MSVQLANRYATLPERFFARMKPSPVGHPRLIQLNAPLARHLGLDPDWLAGPEGVAMLSGSAFPRGVTPVAMAYAGHQFGQFVPQLGDGRALLLGDGTDKDGHPYDLQLKGSGQTPFSRRGDGRAALGPVLREYLLSEAMAAMQVPTSRALAAVATGESVIRETLLPGAVFTRVASSHIRVGTFQYFAVREDLDGLRRLLDFSIQRHYPDLATAEDPVVGFFDAVVSAQARLVAHWMSLGFIHGVMNTDNCSVSGETIDYGPAAFLDEYNPEKVFSSIDRGGRYAFANQPRVAMWNLARLAETLVPLVEGEPEAIVARFQPILTAYTARYEAAFASLMRARFGLVTEEAGDGALFKAFLDLLAANGADYTVSFRALAVSGGDDLHEMDGFSAWQRQWQGRLRKDATPEDARARMRQVNPAVIPRNHRVEAVIDAAVEGDFGPFREMLRAVTHPFEDHAVYSTPPRPEERVTATFCGT